MSEQDKTVGDGTSVRIFVDAHVHIHDCFDLQEFLDAASRNLSVHSAQSGPADAPRHVLCLTESQGDNKFEEIARLADAESAGEEPGEPRWRFSRSDDPACLVATHPQLGDITIIAGRQVVTGERIEVLGLGSTEKWADGGPATEVIESLTASGSLPVLPWGFGKWLGGRRRVVRGLIARYDADVLCLGDNSGRPGIMPEPPEFELARDKGYKILPGSDPLPFRSERNRAGAFGFHFRGHSGGSRTWSDLRRQLAESETTVSRFGELESPFRFARNQVAMQYVSRTRKRS